MKIPQLRTIGVSLALTLFLAFAMDGVGDTLKHSGLNRQSAETHATGLKARVTLQDGTNRIVTLDGFGCPASICSRLFVEGRANDGSTAKIWIDGLSAIRDIRGNSAAFVMKDGTQQQLSFITDFRVLYLQEGSTKAQKLDLSKIQSLQMLESAK